MVKWTSPSLDDITFSYMPRRRGLQERRWACYSRLEALLTRHGLTTPPKPWLTLVDFCKSATWLRRSMDLAPAAPMLFNEEGHGTSTMVCAEIE